MKNIKLVNLHWIFLALDTVTQWERLSVSLSNKEPSEIISHQNSNYLNRLLPNVSTPLECAFPGLQFSSKNTSIQSGENRNEALCLQWHMHSPPATFGFVLQRIVFFKLRTHVHNLRKQRLSLTRLVCSSSAVCPFVMSQRTICCPQCFTTSSGCIETLQILHILHVTVGCMRWVIYFLHGWWKLMEEKKRVKKEQQLQLM